MEIRESDDRRVGQIAIGLAWVAVWKEQGGRRACVPCVCILFWRDSQTATGSYQVATGCGRAVNHYGLVPRSKDVSKWDTGVLPLV